MTTPTYTQSDMEALRERCAKVADGTLGFSKAGDYRAQTIASKIRALPLTTHTEEGTK